MIVKVNGIEMDEGAAERFIERKRKQLREMLEDYRDVQQRLAPELELAEKLKNSIRDLALELDEGAEVEGASVSLQSPYTHTSWDGKGLEEYAGLVDKRILRYKSETKVNPRPTVKAEV